MEYFVYRVQYMPFTLLSQVTTVPRWIRWFYRMTNFGFVGLCCSMCSSGTVLICSSLLYPVGKERDVVCVWKRYTSLVSDNWGYSVVCFLSCILIYSVMQKYVRIIICIVFYRLFIDYLFSPAVFSRMLIKYAILECDYEDFLFKHSLFIFWDEARVRN